MLFIFGENRRDRIDPRLQSRQFLNFGRRRAAVGRLPTQLVGLPEEFIIGALYFLPIVRLFAQQLASRINEFNFKPISVRLALVVLDVHYNRPQRNLLLTVETQLIHADLIGLSNEKSIQQARMIESPYRRDAPDPRIW